MKRSLKVMMLSLAATGFVAQGEAKADGQYGHYLECDTYTYSPSTGSERHRYFNQAQGAVSVQFAVARNGVTYNVDARADEQQGSIEAQDTVSGLAIATQGQPGRQTLILGNSPGYSGDTAVIECRFGIPVGP